MDGLSSVLAVRVDGGQERVKFRGFSLRDFSNSLLLLTTTEALNNFSNSIRAHLPLRAITTCAAALWECYLVPLCATWSLCVPHL